ncbi:MAG: molybdopterin-dependent oxidoreductase, partial [Dehalococcoidia bacterium]
MSPDKTGEERIVHTVCNSHCGGSCEMRVHVKDGKIVRIESSGQEDRHPPCAKGRAQRQRIYAPDRVLYPLKRTGPRGSGEFARISWDEALDLVAKEMLRIREAHGNASLLHFCSMAEPHELHHVQTIDRLLCQFGGYTKAWGTISDEGMNFAAGMTFGARPSDHAFHEDAGARLVIMSSWNPIVTQQGTNMPASVIRAKEAGAKFVCIDPRYTDSAAAVDARWIPIRPGTDAALFLAMAYVTITEDLHDKAFIEAYTFGFDKYSEHLLGIDDGVKKTPAWAEAITGISAETITELAREYATTKPAILSTSKAAGRSAFGEQYHRAAWALEAITGNTTIPKARGPRFRSAGGAARMSGPPNQVEAGMPPRWNALPYRRPSTNSSARVNVSLFTDAILKGKAGGYPADYKFLWLSYTNYLNQLGEANKAVRAFNALDFVVITEHFMTSSAMYADVVLPNCTFFERSDIFGGGGFYGVLPKIIEPLGESRSVLDICTALAPKLGITDYNDKTDEEWIRSIAAGVAPDQELPDFGSMNSRGIYGIRPSPPAEAPREAPKKEPEDPDRKVFQTPSGKIELYSQLIADLNHPQIPAVPHYIESWESVNDPLAEKYPLQLITPHLSRRIHSQFDNLPWLRQLQTQAVSVNTVDAESRGIKDGDIVRVFNDRGQMAIPAEVTERIVPGTVAVPQGAWFAPDENGIDRGGCANTLTKNVGSPGGAFACNTALVQVERMKE